MTLQLDAVIIEISSVKGLSLIDNALLLYRAKHLPLMNWTYGDTGFYSSQTSYLIVKVLIFATDENMRFFLNHCQFRYKCIQGFAESLQHTAYTGTKLDKRCILHNHSLKSANFDFHIRKQYAFCFIHFSYCCKDTAKPDVA